MEWRDTARSRDSSAGATGRSVRLFDLSSAIMGALLLALLVRTFHYQPYNIPSGSMMPTLQPGDCVIVAKQAYGYSRYSFPGGLIPFQGRILGREPERGDVVAYRLPKNTSVDFIKRIVGLPGDEITGRNGIILINGVPVSKLPSGMFVGRKAEGQTRPMQRFVETLPNGLKHYTLDELPNGPLDNFGPVKVPGGHYFMLGDNRDNSNDSRSTSLHGMVPFENLIGPVSLPFRCP